MAFIFSKHALEQMKLRQIARSTVESILKKPDKILNQEGKKVYQAVRESDGKKYLFRIFVNSGKEPNLIITVYKTSKIDKYHEGKV